MPPCDPRRAARMLIVLLAVLGPVQPVFGQARAVTAPPAPTADDYARAEKFLGPAVTPLVVGGSVSAVWLPDDRFTYRSTTADGVQFLLVDSARATKVPAFDHAKLAAALGAAAGGTFDPKQLPFPSIELSADGKSVSFDVETRRWSCDAAGSGCKDAGAARGGRGAAAGGRGGGGGRGAGGGNAVTSPDGKRAVFIKDWNLWVRDVATGQEKALTTDGAENFGYATDNAGWARSARAIVLWSPDSKKVATFQQDERKVGDMYLVETKAGHPVLQQWKYPLPGDEIVAMLHRVVIDADTGAIVRFKMEPDYHRAMLGDNFSLSDMTWSPDATKLAFVVDVARPQVGRRFASRTPRPATSARCSRKRWRPTIESRTGWRVLWATNEVIWYSQRDDWGHLYLYDFATGTLKNQITSGRRARQPDHRGRREDPHGLLRGDGPRERAGPVLPPRLPDRPRREGLRVAHAGGRRSQRSAVSLWKIPGRHVLDLREAARRGAARCHRQGGHAAREGGHLEARRRRLEAADAVQREGARRQDGSLRHAVPPDELRPVEEVPDHQPGLSRARSPAASDPAASPPRGATSRRWPSSASSWSRSTAWARRAGRSRSTTRTTGRWGATTRCPTRWRA